MKKFKFIKFLIFMMMLLGTICSCNGKEGTSGSQSQGDKTVNCISEIRNEGDSNVEYYIKGVVVENNALGYLIYDGTGFINVYLNSPSPYSLGDYLSIKGYVTYYHYNPQFTIEAEVKVLNEKVPENINLDNEIAHTFNANAIEGFVNYNYKNGGIYGYYEGTLIYLNDYYYNIIVDDTIIQLTMFQPNEERLETLNLYLGKKVCGYAVMMFKQDTMYGTMVQISLLSIEDAK